MTASTVPDSPVVQAARAYAAGILDEPILNHSIRVAVYASAIGVHEGIAADPDLVWVASLLHDLGTVIGGDEPLRFEVVGANAARRFLREHRPELDAEAVWEAVALHTSPHIAEERGGLTRLVRLGVRMDFGADPLPDAEATRTAIERDRPRLDIESALERSIVRDAELLPDKAPASSWPHDLLVAHRAERR
ncbi:MAG TPA: HD domain-containing protein [Microbacterium sp.]|uniref:HD domain-containing protein n=1 Tax=Microbacterium sp. TaxID=51671 RepID=UPI002B46699A|nr:HD domain-containing protein [Microbacterium sp.]HKT57118.1 HD domain-containing protein [Microbacterium sp.]